MLQDLMAKIEKTQDGCVVAITEPEEATQAVKYTVNLHALPLPFVPLSLCMNPVFFLHRLTPSLSSRLRCVCGAPTRALLSCSQMKINTSTLKSWEYRSHPQSYRSLAAEKSFSIFFVSVSERPCESQKSNVHFVVLLYINRDHQTQTRTASLPKPPPPQKLLAEIIAQYSPMHACQVCGPSEHFHAWGPLFYLSTHALVLVPVFFLLIFIFLVHNKKGVILFTLLSKFWSWPTADTYILLFSHGPDGGVLGRLNSGLYHVTNDFVNLLDGWTRIYNLCSIMKEKEEESG